MAQWGHKDICSGDALGSLSFDEPFILMDERLLFLLRRVLCLVNLKY